MKVLDMGVCNKIPVIGIFILLLGCSTNKNNYSGLTLKADIEKSEILNFSDIFTFEDIIALETNNVPFSRIKKLLVHSGSIYILTEFPEPKILIFKNDGNLNNSINYYGGRGPGEYKHIKDFIIDEDKETISIIDNTTNKIIIYDLNGKYLTELNIDVFPSKFQKLNNLYFIYSYGNKFAHNIVVHDSLGRSRYLMFPIQSKKDYLFIEDPNNFLKRENHLLFWRPFDYNVYKIEGDRYRSIYKIDFGKTHFDKKNIEKFNQIDELITYCRNGNYSYLFFNFFETKKTISLNFNYTSSIYQYFYDKQTGRSIVIERFSNSLIQEIFAKPSYVDDKFFYYIVYPHIVHKYFNDRELNDESILKEDNYGDIFLALKSMYKKTNFDSNPFIIKTRIHL